jgi:hypothetical protein
MPITRRKVARHAGPGIVVARSLKLDQGASRHCADWAAPSLRSPQSAGPVLFREPPALPTSCYNSRKKRTNMALKNNWLIPQDYHARCALPATADRILELIEGEITFGASNNAPGNVFRANCGNRAFTTTLFAISRPIPTSITIFSTIRLVGMRTVFIPTTAATRRDRPPCLSGCANPKPTP